MNKLNSVFRSEIKLQNLEKSIAGLGKEGYPFRHKHYELNSCIPCHDFSNWIIERLREKDVWAIKLLEWEICKDSGILAGILKNNTEMKSKPKEENVYFWSSCMDVDNQLKKNIGKFINASPNVLWEIYCMCIRFKVSPEIAYGYFYDPNDYAYNYRFYSLIDALSCHKLEFNMQNINNELNSANEIYLKYINEFRSKKSASEIFKRDELNIDYSLTENNKLANKLSQFSIGSRLHFWDLINSSYFISDIRINRLKNLECWFRTIFFGFDEINSSSNLLDSGLIRLIDDKEIILSFLTNNELSEVLSKFNVILKPSAGKSILIKKLLEISGASDYILDYAKSKGLYCFDSHIEDDLRKLLEYKKQLCKILLLLLTIDFGFVFRKSHFFNDNGKYYLVYEDGLKERILLFYGS